LLDKLPTSLTCLRNLTSLDVSNNRLTVLPTTIGELTRLTHLNAAYNVITHLPVSIGSLRKLMTLYLNDNHLSSLSKSIGDLRMLTTLDVCRNRLTVIPAEITCLQYLRYIRTEGCDMITEFDTNLKHSPPTLFELAARTVVRNEMEIPKTLREDLKEYIASAQKCTFCKGPYFTSFVKRYKLIEKGEQNQTPLEYTLCSAHWKDDKERTMAMFTSKPSTSKKPAHIIRAEKARKSSSSPNSRFDLRTPRYQSQSTTRSATLPNSLRNLHGLSTSTSHTSQETEVISIPDRETTASPSSLLSNSAAISISSLARKMHVPSASSNSDTENIFSASSSGNTTPDTAPATMPTRWRAQKIRNRSNTGFLSLSKLQRSSLPASITDNQNITA
jgi:Leucine-rich repeat (LRR) protein